EFCCGAFWPEDGVEVGVDRAVRGGETCEAIHAGQDWFRLAKGSSRVRRDDEDVSFAGAHVVAVHIRRVSEVLFQGVLEGDHRVVLRQRVAAKLKRQGVFHTWFEVSPFTRLPASLKFGKTPHPSPLPIEWGEGGISFGRGYPGRRSFLACAGLCSACPH